MCGICGEMMLHAHAANDQAVRAMLPSLARRGPDHEGVSVSKSVALGHRRLSIIDLSADSNQPMADAESGCELVFNGTIYNYPALRDELKALGFKFRSSGDTEVILKAYLAWGIDALQRLVGMFAFALWDSRVNKLLVVRDRLGIKPLYYSANDKTFRFASNSQALLATGDVDTAIDPIGLQYQLTLHAVIPAPHTILKGIRKMAPGHYMWVDANGASEQKAYWQLNAQRTHDYSDDEWVEAIEESLQKAVDRRLQIADVPVGVLLSGGLDSSLLVGLLARKHGAVNTYTVGFEDQPEERGNEFEYSDAVVERFSTIHHRFHMHNDHVLSRLPEAVAQMPEPMVAQDAIAFYLLAEQVSKDIKVVQSGQGADEVFGGYFWYPKMAAAKGDALQRFAPFYFDRDFDEYLQAVSSTYRQEDYTSALVSKELQKQGADTFMDQVFRFDVTKLIVDDPVKRVDSMTMAWGLEARVPFLDHELVELAMQMPPELKLRDNGKYILKRIARGLIPDSVIDRPKGYFPVPALKYVRGEFLDMVKDLLNSSRCRERGLFARDYIDHLLSAPDQYLTRLQGSKVWHLALLELWLQTNVDR